MARAPNHINFQRPLLISLHSVQITAPPTMVVQVEQIKCE